MDKRTVIVTGAAKGIGRAITEQLLSEGFHVIMIGRNASSLADAAAQLSKKGSVEYRVCDLADRDDIARVVSAWKESLYGIVNNAGVCKTQRLEEGSAHWDEIITTNLAAPYFLVQGLITHVQDGGRIVNIASQLGKEGRAGYSAYCATKFGLIGMTKCWAKELGGRNITVNAVCPGWVGTDMTERDVERLAREKGKDASEYMAEIAAPLELKRFNTPQEIAHLVAFLLSSKASGVTGRDWLLQTIWNEE